MSPAVTGISSLTGVDNFDGCGHAPVGTSTVRPATPIMDEDVTLPEPQYIDALETPALVQSMLRRLPKLPEPERLAYEREFKLSYYFEGYCVALTTSEHGPSVVASGPPAEVLAALDGLSRTDRARVTLVTPQSLRDLARGLIVSRPER